MCVCVIYGMCSILLLFNHMVIAIVCTMGGEGLNIALAGLSERHVSVGQRQDWGEEL